MLRRKPPQVPPLPTPNTRTAQRRDDLLMERTADSVAWRTPGETSWYSCRVARGEVFVESRHYHPAYDEEPWNVTESILPGEFLGGREWERVADEFSRPVVVDILAEVRRLNPGVAPIVRDENGGPWRLAWRAPNLVGLIGGIAILVIVGFLMQRTWARVGEWCELRFRSQPVAVDAVVHLPRVELADRSLPKGQRMRVQEAWITLEYATAGGVQRRPLRVAEFTEFEAERAQRLLAENYREGDRLPVWYVDRRPEQVALSSEELTPGIGWVVLDVALLAFGVVMALGACYLIVVTQPVCFERRDSSTTS